MPSIMEISGLLSGGLRGGRLGRAELMDLRSALGRERKAKKVRRRRKTAPKALKIGIRPIGPSAERMLEIAEMQYAKGQKPLALAWATRAMKRAKAEGKTAVAQRAEELIKTVRGEAILKTAAGLNDLAVIYLGHKMGLF